MILDTCALLFLASGDRRLSRSTRERLGTQRFVRWFDPCGTPHPNPLPAGVRGEGAGGRVIAARSWKAIGTAALPDLRAN